MRFIGGVHPDTVSDPAFVIRRWLDRWQANGFGNFVVERRSDGAVLVRRTLSDDLEKRPGAV